MNTIPGPGTFIPIAKPRATAPIIRDPADELLYYDPGFALVSGESLNLIIDAIKKKGLISGAGPIFDTPIGVIDNTNGGTGSTIINNDIGGNAYTYYTQSNGTYRSDWVLTGTGYVQTNNFDPPNSVYFSSDVPNGIAIAETGGGPIRFFTGISTASATEKAQIAPNGNFGIGVPNPAQLLDLQRDQNSGTSIRIKNSSLGTAAHTSVMVANSATSASFGITGVGYQPSGPTPADSGYLVCNGTGGLSIGTNPGVIRFNTAFTERVRIDQNGLVGIGVSNPQRILDVRRDVSAPTVINLTNNSTGNMAQCWGQYNVSGAGLAVGVNGPNYSPVVPEHPPDGMFPGGAFVQANGPGGLSLITMNPQPIMFYTNQNEVARIDPVGNVGIGTNNPGFPLHIVRNQNAGTPVNLTNTDTGNSALAYYQVVGGTAAGNFGVLGPGYTPRGSYDLPNSVYLNSVFGNLHILTVYNYPIRFYTGGNQRIVIDATGTTTYYGPVILSRDPLSNLEAATKQYVDTHAGGGGGAFLPLAGGTLTGPLGIGATPVGMLDVQKNQNASTDIRLTNSDPGTGARVAFVASNGTAALYVMQLGANNNTAATGLPNEALFYAAVTAGIRFSTSNAAPISFTTQSAERMKIDASGNVGIGVTPVGVLDIGRNQNTSTNVDIYNTDSGNSASCRLVANNGAHTAQLIQYGTGYATSGVQRADGAFLLGSGVGGLTIATTDQPIYFAPSNTERMRIDTSGNVGIGTANPTARLYVKHDSPSNAGIIIQNADTSNLAQTNLVLNNGAANVYLTLQGVNARSIWEWDYPQSCIIDAPTPGGISMVSRSSGHIYFHTGPQYDNCPLRLRIGADGYTYFTSCAKFENGLYTRINSVPTTSGVLVNSGLAFETGLWLVHATIGPYGADLYDCCLIVGCEGSGTKTHFSSNSTYLNIFASGLGLYGSQTSGADATITFTVTRFYG